MSHSLKTAAAQSDHPFFALTLQDCALRCTALRKRNGMGLAQVTGVCVTTGFVVFQDIEARFAWVKVLSAAV